MARKLFLIIAVCLVIGQLVAQASADDGAMLSELSELADGPDGSDDLTYEVHPRVKRRGRGRKFWRKARPILRKVGKGALKGGLKTAGAMVLG